MDFLKGRRFRQTLLCHADTAIDRSLGPERLADFHVASSVKASESDERGAVRFETARGMSREPRTYWTNQLENPDTIAGYHPLGEEIWRKGEGRRRSSPLEDNPEQTLDDSGTGSREHALV